MRINHHIADIAFKAHSLGLCLSTTARPGAPTLYQFYTAPAERYYPYLKESEKKVIHVAKGSGKALAFLQDYKGENN
jgi:hypothetical protein